MSSILSRVAARFGLVSRAQAQADVEAATQRVQHHAALQRRGLLAALTTNDVASWQADGLHINASTETGLATVRARSRDAALNNGWAKQFVGMVLRNVLGPAGFRYQSRVRAGSGDLRVNVNEALEAAHAAWCRKGACDLSGKHTWRDVQRLVLRHVVVDGEVFVRVVKGRGPHGLVLQILPCESVPIGARGDLGDGRIIRQGVEIEQATGRVLAYHMRRDDPATSVHGVFDAYSTPGGLLRVPADEVLHLYLPEMAGQLRGVPWMAAALKPMYQAADFALSGLNKARESAKRGGWLKSSAAATQAGDMPKLEHMTDGQDAAGTPYQSLHDGTWEKVPFGFEPEAFTSDYPNIEYGQFIKDAIRNVASALEVSYITLGNDLEAVNYSSGQLGLQGERTLWLGLQEWFTEHLCQPVLEQWMPQALVAAPEAQGLNFSRLPLYLAGATWQAHRWQPMDPLKHVEAQRSRIEARLTSPQREIAANGDDPDEILAELRDWQAKTADLAPAAARPPAPAANTDAAADAADAAARAALRLRLIANRADE